MNKARTGAVALAIALWTAGVVLADEAPPKEAPASPAPQQAEPLAPPSDRASPAALARQIWPASLETLAGRYRFVQVASPGGLWERFLPSQPGQPAVTRQVSLNELPEALREAFRQAEITIRDLKLPSEVEAEQRPSPSGRGFLRSYHETTTGYLVTHHLPGIGAAEGDSGHYEGPVRFVLEHYSHSNPSVPGVLFQRLSQEVTWGAATLDYADLSALPLKEDGSDGPEEEAPIANARILRSGVEIFAYVDVTHRAQDGVHRYSGCLRLMRDFEEPPPPPTPPTKEKEGTGANA